MKLIAIIPDTNAAISPTMGLGAGVAPDRRAGVIQEEPRQRARDGRSDEQPGETTIGVRAERAVADGGEPRGYEPEPVGPEVDEQGQQRSDMEHDPERQ